MSNTIGIENMNDVANESESLNTDEHKKTVPGNPIAMSEELSAAWDRKFDRMRSELEQQVQEEIDQEIVEDEEIEEDADCESPIESYNLWLIDARTNKMLHIEAGVKRQDAMDWWLDWQRNDQDCVAVMWPSDLRPPVEPIELVWPRRSKKPCPK